MRLRSMQSSQHGSQHANQIRSMNMQSRLHKKQEMRNKSMRSKQHAKKEHANQSPLEHEKHAM